MGMMPEVRLETCEGLLSIPRARNWGVDGSTIRKTLVRSSDWSSTQMKRESKEGVSRGFFA